MPRRVLVLSLLLLGAEFAHADKPRKPVPPLAASQYPMHDAHPNEHVTIAAEPGDTKDTAPHTRLDYYGHGFLPVRVIVTNDSDFAVNLDDARIHFIAADGSSIPAATDEELQRGLFSIKSATGKKIPLPLPVPIPSPLAKRASTRTFSPTTTTSASRQQLLLHT